MRRTASAAVPVLMIASTLVASPQDGSRHDHASDVDRRGDQVMGFDHTKTTHHFRLSANGGAIEVSVDDPADSASRDLIRTHLSHIAAMFAGGDFDAPMLIHGEVPPGVPAMKEFRSRIRYEFQPTKRGGRVVISTKSPAARSAIHDFLRYQIRDHRTRDPG